LTHKVKLINCATFGHNFVNYLLIWLIPEQKHPYNKIRTLNNSQKWFRHFLMFYWNLLKLSDLCYLFTDLIHTWSRQNRHIESFWFDLDIDLTLAVKIKLLKFPKVVINLLFIYIFDSYVDKNTWLNHVKLFSYDFDV
jgi:hypothetical protein